VGAGSFRSAKRRFYCDERSNQTTTRNAAELKKLLTSLRPGLNEAGKRRS
jgi:hypothetical protein